MLTADLLYSKTDSVLGTFVEKGKVQEVSLQHLVLFIRDTRGGGGGGKEERGGGGGGRGVNGLKVFFGSNLKTAGRSEIKRPPHLGEIV